MAEIVLELIKTLVRPIVVLLVLAVFWQPLHRAANASIVARGIRAYSDWFRLASIA